MLCSHMNREHNLPSLSQSNRVIPVVSVPNAPATIASRAPRGLAFLCESPRLPAVARASAPLRYLFLLPLRVLSRQPSPARALFLLLSAFQISNFQSEISALTAMLPRRRPIKGSLTGVSRSLFRTASCNTQSQLAAFPRSADSRRLRSHLTPFRINTYKLSELLIMGDLCRT
jgi:hypothetical protein